MLPPARTDSTSLGKKKSKADKAAGETSACAIVASSTFEPEMYGYDFLEDKNSVHGCTDEKQQFMMKASVC